MDNLNFILGWLSGLVPTLLTVWIGYKIQRANEQRNRKAEILNKRLDQVEKLADAVLNFAIDIDAYLSAHTANRNEADINGLRGKYEDTARQRSVFIVLGDKKLNELQEEYRELLIRYAALLKRTVDMNQAEMEKSKAKILKQQTRLTNLFIAWNANTKKRLDFIRASDPNKYFTEDSSKLSLEKNKES